MEEAKVLFEKISHHVFNLEEGDVFLISELIDEIKALAPLFEKNEGALKVIQNMEQAVHLMLKKRTPPNLTEALSEGIDLLQKISAGKECFDQEYLSTKMNQWLELNKYLETDEKVIPDSVSKELAKESIGEEKQEKTDEIVNLNTEAFSIFLAEAEERLQNAQTLILELEKDFSNIENINLLFRVFHTIKGECGFLKIATLGELAHNIETLLDLMREKKIAVNSQRIDQLFSGVDLTKAILEQLKKGQGIIFNRIPTEKYIESILCTINQEHLSIGDILVKTNKITEQEKSQILNEQKLGVFDKKFGEIAVEKALVNENDIQECLNGQKIKTQTKEKHEETVFKSDPIIKVRASKINYLVDMIGELIIAQGQNNDHSLINAQINKITRTLQYAAMQLRTEKIKSLFNNMKRVVRDVSKTLNKNVTVEISGEELEVDRNLIENLEEPLMHLIRNSVHHGIESGEQRILVNKPAEGKVSIGAERRGNKIIISVTDDGAGLNKEKILKKALEKKLIQKENIPNLSDDEIYNMIFIQGFSTAEAVNYVSGRGVGMDIVRSVVHSLRGRIEIQTVAAEFSKFSMIFPLNTAIIDGMIVRVGNNYLVIPVASIVISIKIKQPELYFINQKVKTIKVNEAIYPVIDLKKYLELGETDLSNTVGIVVENTDKKKFIFTVDEILAKKDIVIKSLGKKFSGLKGISSATVLSGGKVGMVLDVEQIIEQNIKLENL